MSRTVAPKTDGLQFRSFGVESASDGAEGRSFKAIAATENAVMMPDWDRYEMVPEVLLMSGCKMPANRTLPLLNSHNRHDCHDVLGSATELRTEGKELPCGIEISEAEPAIATKVREKHIRDLSIGYRVDKKRYVPKDTTERIAGKDFTGPINVVTSWTPREISLTPIGADDQAKMRGLQENPFATGEAPMLSKELRDKLVARGMAADLDDTAAVAWSVENPVVKEVERKADPPATSPAAPAGKELVPNFSEELRKAIGEVKEELKRTLTEENARQAAEREAERKLREYARNECKRWGFESNLEAVLAECKSEGDVGRKMLDLLHERQQQSPRTSGYIEFGADASDKLTDVMRTVLCLKALRGGTLDDGKKMREETIDKVFPKEKRAANYEECRHWGPMKIAEMCLRQSGVNVDVLTRDQIARGILGDHQALGLRSGSAYHHTGNFLKLTQDAVDMSLRAGYTEYPSTWRQVFRVTDPFVNFNSKHLVQLGELPNWDMWDGISAPNEVSVADAEETWKPEFYHNKISFGLKLLINDSMDALSRIPMMWGWSGARTLNAHVWAQITGNPTMQDGVALFSAATGARKKANLTSSGSGVPTVARLQLGLNLMMQQVGLNTPEGNASQAILGLMPKFFVFPSNLYTDGMQTVKSITDPSASNDVKYNPFTYLTPIVEPLLDANSTAKYYLFADNPMVDTVVVAFLAGYETPQTRSWRDDNTLALNFAVLQGFAAKAVDWRGAYRDDGVA